MKKIEESGGTTGGGERAGGLPYLTDPRQSIRAVLKERPGDFEVEEIPAYSPCGDGDHVYFMVEKTGMTTNGAIARIASALGVKPPAIGVAGQKDARAVTRQWLSLEHGDPERIRQLDLHGIRILDVGRHRNKLKMGHLRGNRFLIRLRDVAPTAREVVAQLLVALEQQGVPNYFGDQRFGLRGDTARVGRALLSNDFKEALELLLGRPSGADDPTERARSLFDRGDFDAAADAWPRGFGDNAKLCRTFARQGGDHRRAILSMPAKNLLFYVSACQSDLFNRMLADRLRDGLFDRMIVGDVAWKHDNGACFSVTDPQTDTGRAQNREISATGPLFGARMKAAEGDTGRREAALLEEEGLTVADFSRPGPWKCAGGRRPFRFFVTDWQVADGSDGDGPYLFLAFTLPPGCYATVLLRELSKDSLTVVARDQNSRNSSDKGDGDPAALQLQLSATAACSPDEQ